MSEQQTYIDRIVMAADLVTIIGALLVLLVAIAELEDIDHLQDAAIAACRVPVSRTR